MRYLTVKEVNKLDRLASEKYGIPSIILMENAGRAVAEAAIKLVTSYKLQVTRRIKNKLVTGNLKPATAKIAVICGGGKNGGDGFVSARYLLNQGYITTVYLLRNYADISGDSLTNFTILKKIGGKTELVTQNNFPDLSDKLKKTTCIIDAIFGTGLKGKIEGIPARVINLINQTGKPVVSVDLPSGLDAKTGLPLPGKKTVQGLNPTFKDDFLPEHECIKAKVTVTMGYPKKGFLNPRAKKFIGKLVIADIGYPKQLRGRWKSL